MNKASVSLLLLTLVFGVAGCHTTPKLKPRAWNLSINKTTPASIEVDLIGVNEFEKPAWEGYDIDKYWQPGDSRRANADKLTATLVQGHPWTIDRDNPKWRAWLDHGATDLLLMAHLPGVPGRDFPAGASDPRRKFISLDKHAWEGNTLQIEVQDTIVRMLTPERPRK
jgi:hypothetical protein